jgi:hypothetical protein
MIVNPWAFVSSSAMPVKISVVNNGTIPTTLLMSATD